jgi:hypothetical protein
MSEINLPRNPDVLGFIIFGLREALKNSVEVLAGEHDTQPGRWLDDLEARCLRSVKLATTEGASIEKEAEGAAGARHDVAKPSHETFLSFGFSLNVALHRAKCAISGQHLHVAQRTSNG